MWHVWRGGEYFEGLKKEKVERGSAQKGKVSVEIPQTQQKKECKTGPNYGPEKNIRSKVGERNKLEKKEILYRLDLRFTFRPKESPIDTKKGDN